MLKEIKNKKMLFSIKIAILFFCMLNLSFTISTDQKAQKIFLEKLNIVYESIQKSEGLNLVDVNNSVLFLEEITKIGSESNAEFLGRFNPSINDYNKWKKWFDKNKTKLVWDKETKKIKLLD